MKNLTKSETLQHNIASMIKHFGSNSFRSVDLTNNKAFPVSNGSITYYLRELVKNGSIKVDENSSIKGVYHVVKPLNFTSSTPKSKNKTSMSKRVLNVCPNGVFTKKDVWKLLDDETSNRLSFDTTFSPLVNRGLLIRVGKRGKFKLPNIKKVVQPIESVIPKTINKKNNPDSIKNQVFKFIALLDDDEEFSTNDVAAELQKIQPNLREKTVRTPITRFMKLGVIKRVGMNKYIKNDEYDFNTIPGHPQTLISTYTKKFNPKKCSNKYAIARMQYSTVAKYVEGDVLIISGPNVKKHLITSKPITKGIHKLHLIDNDPYVFRHILSKTQNIESNINLVFGNIMDTRINVPFQDLDFCTTWIGKDEDEYDPGEIVSFRLMEQAAKEYPVSAMSFTFSKRGMTNNDTVKNINNIIHILGASIKSFDGNNRSYGEGKVVVEQVKVANNKKYAKKHQPNWRKKGRIIELEFYTYRDTGHMMTCLIVYK